MVIIIIIYCLVGIATRLLDGRKWVRIPVGARHFSLLQNVQTGCGARPSVLFSGYRGLSGRAGVGWGEGGGGVNHSPPSSAEVRPE